MTGLALFLGLVPIMYSNGTGADFMKRVAAPMLGGVASAHHQYPDGFALFTGTLFAPTQDRDEPGQRFTHHMGDVVTIRSSHLGALINLVGAAEELPEWSFGLRQLFGYLQSQQHVQAVSLGGR